MEGRQEGEGFRGGCERGGGESGLEVRIVNTGGL